MNGGHCNLWFALASFVEFAGMTRYLHNQQVEPQGADRLKGHVFSEGCPEIDRISLFQI
jgi:hypothetical protein